jgi:hypothetical protein
VVAAATPPDGSEPFALKAVSEPIALEPVVVEPIVAPLELVLESRLAKKIETPLAPSPALDEIVALSAATLPVEPVAPVIEAPKPPALTLETVAAIAGPAPAAREREVAESAKPAPPLPQGFEGLKFPNDGVLTRQWMEFLSQMSASK